MSWARSDGLSSIRFESVLYAGPNGELVLGGWIFLFSALVPGGGAAAHSVPATPAIVMGTIRFPAGSWTSAKSGFKIRGGGLRFDETGVFLMPGTQYFKETQ
jgi:hypothetical protein